MFGTESRQRKLITGSVKSNIGHLEGNYPVFLDSTALWFGETNSAGSAGLAGVIKTTMALEKGVIPPNMLFEIPNPDIDFDGWKLHVPTVAMNWPEPREGCPRRASCSSFGYGGANAHAVLEAPRLHGHATNGHATNGNAAKGHAVNGHTVANGNSLTNGHHVPHDASSRPYLIPLTSHSAEAGKLTTNAFLNFLDESRDMSMADLAYTLSVRRSMHRMRTFAVGKDRESVCNELKEPRGSGKWGTTTHDSTESPRIGFIFTGQGSQSFDMARQLIEESSLFRGTLEACERVLETLPDAPEWSLMEELLKPQDVSRLGQTAFSQPACTAVQLALVVLLREWNIRPAAVCGHSSGEIAAAFAAGLVSLEAAMAVAYYRGKHMARQQGAKGAMLAIGLGDKDTMAALAPFAGRLGIAAVNSPSSTTVSGDADAVEELEEVLASRGTFARKLRVEQAFHSHHMRPLAPKYRAGLDACEHMHKEGTKLPGQGCRMFSSVTGRVVTSPKEVGPSYWPENMVRPVLFADALTGILLNENENDLVDVLVEIGPHPALKGPSRQVTSALKMNLPHLGTLSRGQPAYESLLETTGALFKLGHPVNLEAVNADQRYNLENSGAGRVIAPVQASRTPTRLKCLPTYSWNHKRYWAATRLTRNQLQRAHNHTILGGIHPGGTDTAVMWRNFIRLSQLPWLRDHVVDESIVFPGAGYVTLAVEGALRMRPGPVAKFALRDLDVKAALTLRDSELGTELLVEMRPMAESARSLSDDWIEFTISSYSEDEQLSEHCHGYISVQHGEPAGLQPLRHYPAPDEVASACDWRMTSQQMYDYLADTGLPYGPSFRLVNGHIDIGGGSAAGKISYEPSRYSSPGLDEHTIIHPAVLDNAAHLDWMAGHADAGSAKPAEVFVPRFFKRVEVSGLLVNPAYVGEKYDFLATATSHRLSDRAATSYNVIWSADGKDKLVEVFHKESTAMDLEGGTVSRKGIFFQQRWEPCFDLLDGGVTDVYALAELYVFQYPTARVLAVASCLDEARRLHQVLRPSKALCIWLPDCTEDERHAAEKELAGVQVSEPEGNEYDVIVSTFETDLHQHANANTVVLGARQGRVNPRSAGHTLSDITVIVYSSDQSPRTRSIIAELRAVCKGQVHIALLHELNAAATQDMVVLLDPDSDIATPADWESARRLLGFEDRNMVWLLHGAFVESSSPVHAKLAGLLRVGRNENPESRITTLDVIPSTPAHTVVQRLAQALTPSLAEDEIAIRDGHALIPRLEEDSQRNARMPKTVGHVPSLQPLPSSDTPMQLTIGKLGLLETLWYEPRGPGEDPKTTPGGAEVRVMASALNFRDVAIGVGLIQDVGLGSECAGIVTSVGPGVTHIKPGDRVFAQAKPTHATSVLCHARLCRKIPDEMSFSVAASFSTVVTTAVYALFYLGRLRKGESVLIHSAAGAVGQMAVQLAQRKGAKVLATCSEPKRAFLKEKFGLADQDIFSSRSDAFVRSVREATAGKGVDVVINSLSGKLLEATWNCMAPFGRFIEIGKRDIHQNSYLGMEPFRQNITFAAVDMITVFQDNAPLADELLDEACRLLYTGEIKEPQSLMEFSFGEAEKAFRLLQLGKHVGKIILVPKEGELVRMAPPRALADTESLLNANKTYLLVGGLGGLGAIVAEWMYQAGARKFAFLSRSGGGNDNSTLQWLRAKQASVTVYKGDVSKGEDVQRVAGELDNLGGILHLAAVSHDGALRNMEYKHWNTCVKVKADGAWNLHAATSNLDFFICFSSNSTIVGTPGQANYSAANAYLDGLMQWRRSQGLVGASINIAGVSGVGMFAEMDSDLQASSRRQLDTINPSEFFHLLEEALRSEAVFRQSPTVPSSTKQLMTGVNIRSTSGVIGIRSAFRTLCAQFSSGDAGVESRGLSRSLMATDDADERAKLLRQGFIDKIGAVLDVGTDSITSNSSLPSLGLDSIVAVELRRWFKDMVSVDLPLFDLLSQQSIDILVAKAVGLMPKAQAAQDTVQQTGTTDNTRQESKHDGQPTQAKPIPQSSGPVAMSALQQRLWTFYKLYDDASRFNLCVTARFPIKSIDSVEASTDMLRKALMHQAHVHPILRTAFIDHGTWVEQKLLDEPNITLTPLDLTQAADPEQQLEAVVTRHKRTSLNLAAGQISSCVALLLPGNECVMLTVYHHLALDARSATIVSDTFNDVIRALQSGTEPSIAMPRTTYADFAAWHNGHVASLDSDRAFWRSYLASAPPTMPLLPFAQVKERPASFAPQTRQLQTVPAHLVRRLRRQCAAAGVTPYHFAVAALRAFLFRVSGQRDVVLGMLDGTRPHVDVLNVAGYFVNVLPVRLDVEPDMDTSTFKDFVRGVSDNVLTVMAHAGLPFSDIAKSIGAETKPGLAPIAQVAVNWWKGPETAGASEDNDATVEVDGVSIGWDISLEITDAADGGLNLAMEHSLALYADEDMGRFTREFAEFFRSVIRDQMQLVFRRGQ